MKRSKPKWLQQLLLFLVTLKQFCYNVLTFGWDGLYFGYGVTTDLKIILWPQTALIGHSAVAGFSPLMNAMTVLGYICRYECYEDSNWHV